MELDRLIPNIRPRSVWEASDLGMLMGRHWFGPLAVCFAVPLLVIGMLGAPWLHDSPILFYLWLWWFKPLYERLPLHYLSRAIFSDAPALQTLLRHPFKALGPGLLPALTYQRLSLQRSFVAPVFVLEGLTSIRAAERKRALSARTGSFANWLTILGIHIEAALMLGALVGLVLLLPDNLISDTFEALFIEDSTLWGEWLINGLGVLAFIVFGPFYVAGGFALYLNRRVQLEAWDIEIAFRRLAARTEARLRTGLANSIAVLLTVFLCGGLLPAMIPGAQASSNSELGVPDLRVAELPASPTDRLGSKAVIDEVMAGPEFHQIETRRYPVLLQKFLDQLFEESDADPADDADMLALLRSIAMLLEVLLWAGAILLALWLGWQLRLLHFSSNPFRSGGVRPPASIFGIELDGESLPADVPVAAASLWHAGDLRAALSLLLRDQLLRLVTENGCRFRKGDTEQECLQEVRSRAPKTRYSAFAQLLNLWLRVAYAHRRPMDQEFEKVNQALVKTNLEEATRDASAAL